MTVSYIFLFFSPVFLFREDFITMKYIIQANFVEIILGIVLQTGHCGDIFRHKTSFMPNSEKNFRQLAQRKVKRYSYTDISSRAKREKLCRSRVFRISFPVGLSVAFRRLTSRHGNFSPNRPLRSHDRTEAGLFPFPPWS